MPELKFGQQTNLCRAHGRPRQCCAYSGSSSAVLSEIEFNGTGELLLYLGIK
jgi:hypothetical protein